MRHIPNIISVIRILLVLPIALALGHQLLALAIMLFALAAVSDAADGYLAKRFGWQSELGAVLDPVADKLLLAAVFITLSFMNLVPLWLMIAAVARDVVIVSGAAAYRIVIGPLTAHPSFVSKVNTLCQAAYILAVVSRAKFMMPPDWVVTWLGALVFATVAVSGIDYVLVYGRRAAAA
ncbi:MAG TPA: CDP-alcohol phosphatidyltransferase family protein [Steroidobacteraceae bacterium]|jgi:cardiolipin synthase|nr:CDP-alcohol phosphatidyltransferase family protein [Steroidobacteraceae bacterium]